MGKSVSPALPGNDRRYHDRAERFSRICLRWVMVPLLTLLVLASIGFVVAASIQAARYAIAVSVPGGFLLMLWVALRARAAFKPLDNLPLEPPSRIPWRLVDKRLSHWGVWRADVGRLPVEVGGYGGDRQAKAYIYKLLDDWSFRSARGGRVVRISGPVAPALSAFGDGPKGWKVYRVTLDDGELRRTGWLRFGTGWVEFQLSRHSAEPTTPLELGYGSPFRLKSEPGPDDILRQILEEDTTDSEPVAEPAGPRNPFLSQHHPMWDRWIDV
jgi:hypothetical protein